MRPPFPNPNQPAPQAKVCGLTQLGDAMACAEAGVAAIGINFWPKSKRWHPLASARQWLDAVPEGVCRVGVFVNATAEEIDAVLRTGCIDAVQFHGDEPEDFVRQHLDRGVRCIRALALRSEADLEKVAACPAVDVLLDAWQPGAYGGGGVPCDWALAQQAVRGFPDKRIILSGGLAPENVASAVEAVRPHAVDVASGVELAPGRKDSERVRRFAREVARCRQSFGGLQQGNPHRH
ncbi:MAG: phosphoribosylanthranilate isomerase [Verrucomicrobiales bacterium]|nr:phosphoribosylanthranilate isomerase [Verrucomicrobiales bacterium]